MDSGIYLGTGAKKVLKTIHILLSSCVLGSLAAILAILIFKQNYNFGDKAFAADLITLKIFSYVTTYSFFALIITAAVYGIFTEWGFVNYKWIAAKIILALAAAAVTMTGLSSSINGMASISDAGFNTSSMSTEYLRFGHNAVIFATIDIAILVLIFAVSVAKPWGRTGLKLKQKTALAVLLPVIAAGICFGVVNNAKLVKIRNMNIGSIDLSAVSDGTYDGHANVGSYVYNVKVDVKNHKITDIQSVNNRKSPYVTYAEGVFSKIIKKQSADVDAVTGATTTSKAFMKAVENAVNQK